MKTKEIELGKYYYFGKCIKKFKCTYVGKILSIFIDYKKTEHHFYNSDMYINKYIKNKC